MSQLFHEARARFVRPMLLVLSAMVLGHAQAQEPGAAPAEVRAALGVPVTAIWGWIVDEADHICGISDPRHMSNPAVIDYDDCIEATAAWKEMKRKRIDPESIEGRALRKKAETAVTKACQLVREDGGYCSIWKAVRHTDGRHVPDVTEEVKERF